MRSVLERDQEFTVDPYGAEMVKVMSPRHNGGFSTFVLSTDDTAVYEPDKRLLSLVCSRMDAERITGLIHQDCMRRVGAAVRAARVDGRAAPRRGAERRPLRAGDAWATNTSACPLRSVPARSRSPTRC